MIVDSMLSTSFCGRAGLEPGRSGDELGADGHLDRDVAHGAQLRLRVARQLRWCTAPSSPAPAQRGDDVGRAAARRDAHDDIGRRRQRRRRSRRSRRRRRPRRPPAASTMASGPPAMSATTWSGDVPNVGGNSEASSTPMRPDEPAPDVDQPAAVRDPGHRSRRSPARSRAVRPGRRAARWRPRRSSPRRGRRSPCGRCRRTARRPSRSSGARSASSRARHRRDLGSSTSRRPSPSRLSDDHEDHDDSARGDHRPRRLVHQRPGLEDHRARATAPAEGRRGRGS